MNDYTAKVNGETGLDTYNESMEAGLANIGRFPGKPKMRAFLMPTSTHWIVNAALAPVGLLQPLQALMYSDARLRESEESAEHSFTDLSPILERLTNELNQSCGAQRSVVILRQVDSFLENLKKVHKIFSGAHQGDRGVKFICSQLRGITEAVERVSSQRKIVHGGFEATQAKIARRFSIDLNLEPAECAQLTDCVAHAVLEGPAFFGVNPYVPKPIYVTKNGIIWVQVRTIEEVEFWVDWKSGQLTVVHGAAASHESILGKNHPNPVCHTSHTALSVAKGWTKAMQVLNECYVYEANSKPLKEVRLVHVESERSVFTSRICENREEARFLGDRVEKGVFHMDMLTWHWESVFNVLACPQLQDSLTACKDTFDLGRLWEALENYQFVEQLYRAQAFMADTTIEDANITALSAQMGAVVRSAPVDVRQHFHELHGIIIEQIAVSGTLADKKAAIAIFYRVAILLVDQGLPQLWRKELIQLWTDIGAKRAKRFSMAEVPPTAVELGIIYAQIAVAETVRHGELVQGAWPHFAIPEGNGGFDVVVQLGTYHDGYQNAHSRNPWITYHLASAPRARLDLVSGNFEEQKREEQMRMALQGNGVVPISRTYECTGKHVVSSPFCWTGNLIEQVKSLKGPERLERCLMLAKGIARINELGYVMVDVKPENATAYGWVDLEGVVKSGEAIRSYSALYVHPQMIKDGKADPKYDAWSFAWILWNLYTNTRTLPTQKIYLNSWALLSEYERWVAFRGNQASSWAPVNLRSFFKGEANRRVAWICYQIEKNPDLAQYKNRLAEFYSNLVNAADLASTKKAMLGWAESAGIETSFTYTREGVFEVWNSKLTCFLQVWKPGMVGWVSGNGDEERAIEQLVVSQLTNPTNMQDIVDELKKWQAPASS